MHDRGDPTCPGTARNFPPSSTLPELTGRPPHQIYPPTPYRHHRAIFLSDMHLGARMCQAGKIIDFLERNMADTIYLVGDIIDNWDPLSPSWTQDQLRVLHKLLSLPNTGRRVIYVPGNHDGFFRQLVGTEFGGIEIRLDVTHEGADGRRYVVVHGDCCDIFELRAPFLSRVGSIAEGLARGIDTFQRHLTRLAGLNEWSGIEDAILWTQALVRKCDRFEERLSDLAVSTGADGVICGHFHEPALRSNFGPIYANCGDWSSSCTAIVEDLDGCLHLVTASECVASSRADSKLATEAECALVL